MNRKKEALEFALQTIETDSVGHFVLFFKKINKKLRKLANKRRAARVTFSYSLGRMSQLSCL